MSSLGSSKLPVSVISGEITDPKKSSEEEIKLFLAVLERLDIARSKKLLPHPIDDILKSFSREPFTKEIDCKCFPQRKVDNIKIMIRSGLIRWDASGSKKLATENLGAYSWNECEIRVRKRVKTLKFTNYLLLDSEKLKQKEEDEFGRIENEGLLYHELLHGQLLIDAMQTSPVWQKKVCSHDFDFTPVDLEHRFIYDLQSDFMKKAALEKGYQLTVKKINSDPKTGGNFELVLGDISEFLGKGDLTLMYYVPPGSSMSKLEFELPKDAAGKIKTSGPIKIKGKISEGNGKGKCYYWILRSAKAEP